MKIVIDLTQLADNLSGLERYAMNITREMILTDTETEYVLFYKNKVCELLEDINHRKNVTIRVYKGKNKLVFNQLQLPIYLYKEKNADKYLFLAFPCPLLFRKKGICTMIADLTCWDCPETMKTKAKYYFRATITHSVKVSEKLITISEYSRQRILAHFGGSIKEGGRYRKLEEKILLAYCAVSEAFTECAQVTKEQEEELRRKYNLPRNYFLCLSTLEPRKNLQLLLKAYGNLLGKRREDVKGSTVNREVDIPVVIPEETSTECQDIPSLVLAGRKGWLMDEILADIENKYPGKVIVTGFIEDADLPQIYRMADCFVFPSLYEGFGMPPLEALAVGTPVISSDAASMPEVLGDHAAYFASGNEAELTKALQTFLKQPKTQEPYTDSRFDWKRSAEKILHMLMLETKHE